MEFLEQLFSDEVQRRDGDSAGCRARAARLDPTMTLEAWDDTAKITYDRAVCRELVSLRFVDQARNALIRRPSRTWLTLHASFHCGVSNSPALPRFDLDTQAFSFPG